MFEYHGWIMLRSTPTVEEAEPPLRLSEIRRLVRSLPAYGLVDLRAMNGTYAIHIGGSPNRPGGIAAAVVDLFVRVGHLAPGSYGVLYMWDDDDPDCDNAFRVVRLARGRVTQHPDTLLSPTSPTLENADAPAREPENPADGH